MKNLFICFWGLFPIIYVMASCVWGLFSASSIDLMSEYLLCLMTISPGVFLLVLPFYYAYRYWGHVSILFFPAVIIAPFIKFPMIFYWALSSGTKSAFASMMIGFDQLNLAPVAAMLLTLTVLYLHEKSPMAAAKPSHGGMWHRPRHALREQMRNKVAILMHLNEDALPDEIGNALDDLL